jgi:hypothetical protein
VDLSQGGCAGLSGPLAHDPRPWQVWVRFIFTSAVSTSESFSLLCSFMPWESTFVGQALSFFVSQILFCLVHTSVICGSFSCRFCLPTWLLIFNLGHFVCHLGLLCSFSDNFVCCLSLLDQGCSVDVIIYLIITLSSDYLPFAVVDYLIPLLAICSTASHHISHYLPFAVVTYI